MLASPRLLIVDDDPMSSGHILDEDISKCTGIFRKTKGRWLYVHEHCSEGVGDSPASNGVTP